MGAAFLTRIAAGVWIANEPVRVLGLRFTTTMTVLRLPDGGLVLVSPVPLTPERREAVESLGDVAHLYAPNRWHHLFVGDWANAFGDARLHAPAGLAKKRRDLRIDRVAGVEPDAAFDGVIDEVPIEGFRLEEIALVHRPSRTAIVADLASNVGRPEDAWTRFYTKTFGFYDRVAISRAIRWLGFSDRPAARRSVDALLAHDFDRLVVGHGAPIAEGARDVLRVACEWLPA